jgi:deazaflavin-dependent oxidoreductase (nitroreductase family)
MPNQDPVIEEFRRHGGHVGGYFEQIPLLLLTTIGAKSGLPRVTPLAYMEDGDRWIIAGGAGGADHHPGWYWNLVSNPGVTVEVGSEAFPAAAKGTVGEERATLFERFASEQPQLLGYAAEKTREIPIVALVPLSRENQ